MITLRDYQQDLVDKIRSAYGDGHRRVLAVSPCRSGKTRVFSYITDGAARKKKRVCITAHRANIIDQIGKSLSDLGVTYGMIKPGHSHTDDAVQVAMIQSLGKRLGKMEPPDLLVVDEAHHVVSKVYLAILDAWPKTKVLCVTATAERLDGKGLGDVCDTLVLGPQPNDLIERGFLAGYDYYAPPVLADFSSINDKSSIDEIATAMDKATITGDVIEHYRDILNGKPSIAYCCNRQHMEHVAAQFRDAGFRATTIDGTMTSQEQRRRIDALSRGEINLLSSVNVVSEGTDVEQCYGSLLLRRTQSLSMFIQQASRCLTLKPNGERAVILDHVGNINRFGMPTDPRAWTLDGRAKRDTAAGIRQCRKCYQIFPAGCPVECADSGCPMKQAGGGEPVALPENIGGRLTKREDPLAWAGGISLALASGAEWRDLLARAGGDVKRLLQISRARGYRKGWPQHVAREIARKNGLSESQETQVSA